MRQLIYILLLSILFISCKKQVYHSFTDEERAYLVYDKGNIIKLKDEVLGDTIELKVTDRYVRYIEDSPSSVSFSRKVHYEHQGEVKFTNPNSLFEGYIYIYKDKIDQFSLDFSIQGFRLSGESKPTSIEDITVNGITYKNVHNFYSYIYFSQEYGFVQLIDTANGKHYTRVP